MSKPAPPTESVLPVYQVQNPQEMAQNMLRLMEQSGKVMATLAERGDGQNGPYSLAGEMAQASQAWNEVTQKLMLEPARFAEIQGEMMRDYTTLWTQTLRRMMGETVEPVVSPEPGDNRFKDPEWSANPYFDFWKQAYLLSTRCAEVMLTAAPNVDERTRAKAEFYLRQVSSACAPSNFPLTNPEVLRETFKTNAHNLVAGMELLSRDVQRSDDLLKVAQTDLDAFEVGRNLAVTPGKVVFQNDVCQLLQYTPTTPNVKARPILIVPPWINKFYILDLTQPKSLIRYLVAQGFTVFLISWVNPDGRLASKTFEDYMKEGILSATDAALRETGERSLNILGYCVGGTLLATTLAYAASRGDQSFESATFLTTQTDFTHAGDLALFVDDVQLAALKQMMAERGYLDGSRMATVFNMMRPRDLIWPYIINNYMLGKKPMPFDLLYWNQDSTRMPSANHMFYLKEFYADNKLSKGELTIAGVNVDLGKIRVPIFHLATKEDHIAPAKSCYIGAKLFGGPVEFVLAGSGHIAGVVNPPDKVKYQYWTSGARPETLSDWLATAKETPGSWWPHWVNWLNERSGGSVPARNPGARLGVIEDAPGSYVRTKA